VGTGNPLRVGIVVFDDAEELDVVGPFDVLAAWAAHSALRPEVVTYLCLLAQALAVVSSLWPWSSARLA
jgi:putative intracellular protease/amidase